MRFRLRDHERDVEILHGHFIVGRGDECQLSLDDKLVSRRHARFTAIADKVWVEDLGSRNGVLVNGVKIGGRTELANRDVVRIGETALELVMVDDQGKRKGPSADETLTQFRAGASVVLVSGLIEKSLALGKIEDAQRLLAGVLRDAFAMLGAGLCDAVLLADVARRTIRVVTDGGDIGSVDTVFNLYAHARWVMPSQVVDELHALAHRRRFPYSSTVRSYVTDLQERASSLSPTERFALKRLEGLVRVLQS